MTVARVTQGFIETLTVSTVKDRVTQGFVETLTIQGPIKNRITQGFIETLIILDKFLPTPPSEKGKQEKEKEKEKDKKKDEVDFVGAGRRLIIIGEDGQVVPRYHLIFDGAIATAIAQYWVSVANIDNEIYNYDMAFSNYQAITDPTVNDDASEGYAPGSNWVNKTDNRAWVCIRATVGDAVWQEVAVGILDGGSA